MAQDNVLLLDSSSSKSSSFLEKEAETRQATWLEWLERALRSLPKSIHNPADIARSFLMGRGLPQQQLGWLDTLALYFADYRASHLPFGESSWSALTANGATLLLPCLRWVDGIPKLSYVQSLLLKQDESGAWRKEGRGLDGMDKLYPSKKKTKLEKRGAFFPLCSLEELESARIFWICEGFATGAALRSLLALAGQEGVVLCALDAGNLQYVIPPNAESVRYFADMDGSLTGQRMALKAAKKVQEADGMGEVDVRVYFHAFPFDSEAAKARRVWAVLPKSEQGNTPKPPKVGLDALDLFEGGECISPETLELLKGKIRPKQINKVAVYTRNEEVQQYRALERFEAKDLKEATKGKRAEEALERLVASAKAKVTPRKDNGYIPAFPLGRTIFVDATLGGGKSYQQIEELKACANALLSTHRRAIVSNLVDRCPDLFDYRALPTLAQGLTSIERFEAAKKLITCIDSLNHSIHSAGNCSRDLIEIDEAFASFASAAMPKNGSDQDGRIIDRIALLEALLTSCKRAIFAEAALDPCTPRLVGTLDAQSQQEPLRVKWDGSRWISAEGTLPSAETPVVWAEFINKHPFKWRFSPTEDALLAHLESAFLAGEKLAIFVVHKSDVEGLAHRLKTLRPNAKGLLMHGDLGLEDRERAATQAAWAECDFAIYNTAAESGLSVDVEGFDATYVLGKIQDGTGWRSFYQGAARVRKTRTMEIRAWIDDAEGKPQSIEEIKASFVQNEDAYKALYRPFVKDGKIEETLEAPAWMERVADFVAQARAAHEATCTKRLTQLLERLAFEGADLGSLPSKNAFGKEAIKALQESKKAVREKNAETTAHLANNLPLQALQALHVRAETPSMSLTAKEDKAINDAKEKALDALRFAPQRSVQEQEALAKEDGKAALEAMLLRMERGCNSAKPLVEQGLRVAKLVAERARDAAKATTTEIQIAKAHKLKDIYIQGDATPEDAKTAQDRRIKARRLVLGLVQRFRPDLLLESHLHTKRQANTDDLSLVREGHTYNALLSMMDGFPEVAALLHVVEQMFHQKSSHEPMLLDPSFFTDGCTKEELLQSFNESKSYIQARLEAATTQGSQQTLQAPAHTPTTNLNFYIGRVCADPSRSEVCAVTNPLLHKAITHFGEESNARLHTPLPSLSFLDRRGFFSYNESYNVNRDIGTILDFFGIKRKKQQTTIEGKRTWIYSIDGETVIHVLLDAKKELDRWVSKAAKATPEEVAKRISTTLEAKLQDEGSRVVLTTPQRRTKQTAFSEERQEIDQAQSDQAQSDQAQCDQIQRTPFVVQPNVIFGSGYERGLVVWLAPSELAEVFQHKDPITRACLACWFYDPVKGNGRYLIETEGGRPDRL